jgi:hypothetical protein
MSYCSMKYVISLFLLAASSNLKAVTSSEVFAKYPNTYFIETGSYCGDGIQMALSTGFQEIYSIELSPEYHERCNKRFAGIPQIHLILGDSASMLPRLLQQIDAPATFWLDGHYSGGDTAKGNSNSPILQELDAIAQHPIKNHTILIDDIRQAGTTDFDLVTLGQIAKKIQSINPKYRIFFEDGYIANDVLVAKVFE